MTTDKQYSKSKNTAYVSRTRRYIDENGNEGIETDIYKKSMAVNIFGVYGWEIYYIH